MGIIRITVSRKNVNGSVTKLYSYVINLIDDNNNVSKWMWPDVKSKRTYHCGVATLNKTNNSSMDSSRTDHVKCADFVTVWLGMHKAIVTAQ